MCIYHLVRLLNIKQGTNTTNKINFDCNNIPIKLCTQKYCGTSSPVLTSIIITPVTESIIVNGTAQLTAICKDQNNNTMICPTLIWTSSDVSKVTISSSGLVTGMAIGTANITAMSGSIISNPSVITIATGPVVTKFNVFDISNIGVMTIKDDAGTLTKTQACTDMCAKLNQM